MSIFRRLYGRGLGPEDYFTEIVAHLLRETDGLLFDWAAHLGLVDVDEYVDFDIRTQVIEEEGRPDIFIELLTEDGEDLIYIESKLDSHEGQDQLKRYAGELVKKRHAGKRLLLFITRDYEPKDKISILKDVPANSVTFRQLRWSDFYKFLEPIRDDRLIDEVCTFMEEQGMSQSNQFSPTDILVMSNLPKVISLMNETLYGEVSERFKEVVGVVSSYDKTRGQLRHKRYALMGRLFNRGYCLQGYWFREGAYPMAGIYLQMHPSSPDREAVLAMMRDIGYQTDWEAYNLNLPRKWASVGTERPLNELTAGEDHVKTVKEYFLGLLDELAEIKKQYPEIAWNVGIDEEE